MDSPFASRDPMSEFNVNRELHDQIDFLQNPPYVHVQNADGSVLITAGTVTAVTWSNNPAQEDTDGMYQYPGLRTRLTAPLAGVYEVIVNLIYPSGMGSAGTTRRLAGVQKNGLNSTWSWSTVVASTAAGSATEVQHCRDIRLAVGDYVEALAWQDSAVSTSGLTNFGGDCYFQARWVRR